MIVSLLSTVALLTAFTAFGRFLLEWMGESAVSAAEFLQSFGIGVAVFSYAFFLAGLAHSVTVPLAVLLLLIIGIVACFQTQSFLRGLAGVRGSGWRGFRQDIKDNRSLWIVSGLFLLQAALNVLNALTPPTEGDTLNTYLVLPKWWALSHHFGIVTNANYNGIYGIAPMLSTVSLFFSNDILAQLMTGCLFGLMASAAVYALVRRLQGSHAAALLSATLFLCLPDVWYEAASTKIDMVAVTFDLLAVLSLMDNRRSWRQRACLAGFFSGISMWSKLVSLLMLPTLAVFQLVWMFQEETTGFQTTRWLKSITIMGAVAFIIALPGYAHNQHLFGNPLYPVGIGFFGAHSSNAFRLRDLGQLIKTYHGWTGILPSIAYDTFDLRFHGMGPAFLTFLPLTVGLFFTKRGRAIGFLTLVYFIGWYHARQVSRDMLLVLAVSTATIGLTIYRPYLLSFTAFIRRFLCLIALGCCAAMILQNAMNAYFFERFQFLLHRPNRDVYLENILSKIDPSIPRWDMVCWANANIPKNVYTLNYFSPVAYYFDIPLLNSTHPLATELNHEPNERRLIEALSAHHIHYLFVHRLLDGQSENESVALLKPPFLQRHFHEVFSNAYAQIFALND